MSDWGVPDWLVASAYPASHELTDRQWRWQFLRRRHEYRSAWTRCADRHAMGANHVSTEDPDDFRERFRLTVLLDPRLEFDDWRLWQAFFPLSGYGYTWKTLEAGDRDEDAGRIGYMFDLKKPLGLQIERAEIYLADLQAERFGKVAAERPGRRELWPLYLRALDASDAKATLAKMASAFWPGEAKTPQSARDVLDRAKELRTNFPF